MASARPRLVPVGSAKSRLSDEGAGRSRIIPNPSGRSRIVPYSSLRSQIALVGSLRPRLNPNPTEAPDTATAVPGVAGLMLLTSSVALPANYTGYLKSSGVKTDSGEGIIPVAEGTAGKLLVRASQAPGPGETFVYTVLKNGLATALTVTLTGAQTHDFIETDVAFADEDELALRAQISSGAASAVHDADLKYTPA